MENSKEVPPQEDMQTSSPKEAITSCLSLLQSLEPGMEDELSGLRKEDCIRMAEDLDSITSREKEYYITANELLDMRYSLDSKGIAYDWSSEIVPLILQRIEACYSRIESGDVDSSDENDYEYKEEDAINQLKEEKEERRWLALKQKKKLEQKKARMPRKRGRPKGSKNKIRY